ncbi:MAG: prolipoprotein diacylglyceryl transferase [Pseudopedobacter sp.]|nr:prolipoprotein diacylglyceryl transferase [Deinococcales bacterium]
MNPVFLRIGDFTIAWYGVLMTAGIVIGAIIAQKFAAKRGLNERLMSDLLFWAIIWGIIGARIGFILTSFSVFKNASFFDYINIRQGGLAVHGAVIAGILVGVYYTWRYKINFYRYGDLFAPMLGLGIIGGRLGNIMNGADTVGRPTNSIFGFRWPDWATAFHTSMCNKDAAENLAEYCPNGIVTQPVHFTQLYGVIIGIIMVLLGYLWLRSRKPGYVFWQAILWYSILRAGWEETFRLNPLWVKVYEGPGKFDVGFFTATQLFSIPLIVVCIFMLWRISKQPDQPHPIETEQSETPSSVPAGVA